MIGFIKAGLGLGGVAAAGVAFMLSDGSASLQHSSAATENRPAVRLAERFRLVLYGADTGCEVVKGDSISVRKARLMFGADCADELPNVANARFWSEQEDGSVAFIMEDGRVAIRFAAGDGHAFETYEAGAPLISLIAKVD
jgi:ferric-dicitrate binding protein FerR (iron transport regulator)